MTQRVVGVYSLRTEAMISMYDLTC